jgi:hypothetical protein
MTNDYNPTGRQKRREIPQIQEECSAYVLMSEILEKLKILNYEQQFLRKKYLFFFIINFFLKFFQTF